MQTSWFGTSSFANKLDCVLKKMFFSLYIVWKTALHNEPVRELVAMMVIGAKN